MSVPSIRGSQEIPVRRIARVQHVVILVLMQSDNHSRNGTPKIYVVNFAWQEVVRDFRATEGRERNAICGEPSLKARC
jgi:hypothetical protein